MPRQGHQFLAERIQTYKETGKGIGYAEQQKALTLLRQEDPAFVRFAVAVQSTALWRLEKTFQAFFRRLRAGGMPGFARFKGRRGVHSVDIPDPVIQ